MTNAGFAGLILSTGEHWFTGPEKRINDATMREYVTLAWAHRGQDPNVIVQKAGGTDIIDQTMLSITPQAIWTDNNSIDVGAITETGINHKVDWRLAKRPLVVDDYAESHNRSAMAGSGGGAQKFKNYAKQKFQELETDMDNLQENAYWAPPNYVQMETGGTSGLLPMSILASINEHSNGLPSSIHAGGVWSQIQTIASTATGFSNYVPYQKSYSNLTVNDPDNVINALDFAAENLKISPPPTKQEYFEAGSDAEPPFVWFTDIKGKVRLKQIARASNDRWEDPTDANFGAPTFAGSPIVCPVPLETVIAFPTGAANVLGTMQATAGNKGGSRYFGVNFKYYKTIYDADWYMRMIDVGREQGRATRHTMWYYLGMQNFNLSRRRHACIYPANNIA
jgi:hypothetical protein